MNWEEYLHLGTEGRISWRSGITCGGILYGCILTLLCEAGVVSGVEDRRSRGSHDFRRMEWLEFHGCIILDGRLRGPFSELLVHIKNGPRIMASM